MAQQPTDEPTAEAFDDEPLDETHYGHVRYAAHETAGVRWYDPRTGAEYLQLPTDESLDDGERRLLYVRIVPYRPSEFGTPADQYATELIYQRREDDYTHQSRGRGDVCDSLDEARSALRATVDDYDEYPRKDAVKERTGMDFTEADDVEVVDK